MIKLLTIYLQKHSEGFVSAVVGGGSLSILLTNIDIILKILVAAATLIYFIMKIVKELKK